MEKNQATYSIILFTKKVKKDDTYPVKLRITYKREQIYYGLGSKWSFTKDIWGKINSQNARGEYKKKREKLIEIENKAKNIISYFEDYDKEFSFKKFEELFFNETNNTDLVFEAFRANIIELKQAGKTGSANTVESA